MLEALRGAAVCEFKLERFESAVEWSRRALELAPEESVAHSAEKQLCLYLMALSYKMLERFSEAEKCYWELRQVVNGSEREEIKGFVFGLLLAPLSSDRNFMLDHLGQYRSLYRRLGFQPEPSHIATKSALLRCCNSAGEWVDVKTKEALALLRQRPFFARFSPPQLAQILPLLRPRTHPAGSLLLLRRSEVAVILQGSVVLYSHAGPVCSPSVVAKYGDNLPA